MASARGNDDHPRLGGLIWGLESPEARHVSETILSQISWQIRLPARGFREKNLSAQHQECFSNSPDIFQRGDDRSSVFQRAESCRLVCIELVCIDRCSRRQCDSKRLERVFSGR